MRGFVRTNVHLGGWSRHKDVDAEKFVLEEAIPCSVLALLNASLHIICILLRSCHDLISVAD